MIARADLERAAWQAAGWVLASVLPHRADTAVIRAAHALRRRVNRAEVERVAQRIATILTDRLSPAAARDVAEQWYARTTELSWGRVRALHRSDWRIRIDLEGSERLDRALARGRGAVLWFSSFCDSAILMRALAEHGARLSHLSADDHGAPAHSRFGLRFVAPIHHSVERRYLAERIVMHSPTSPGYVRRVRQALGANRAVTVRGDLARHATQQATCLNRPFRFASGAPRLAHAARSPLLTAAIVRPAPARYRVILEEELTLPEDRRDFVVEAVAEYARRLGRRIAESPADWEGWRWVDEMLAPS